MGDAKKPVDPMAATVPPEDPRALASTARADDVRRAEDGRRAALRATPLPPQQSYTGRWLVLGGVLIGAGITAGVLAARHKNASASHAAGGSASGGSAAAPVSAPAPVPAPAPAAASAPAPAPAAATAAATAASSAAGPTSIDDLIKQQDQAINDGTSAPFEALLSPKMFGFGIDASEVRVTADNNYELVRHVIGLHPMTMTAEHWIGKTTHAAWIAEKLTFADKHVVELTEVASEHDGRWRVDAWHWAWPVVDAKAFSLAKAGKLVPPNAVPTGPETGDTLRVVQLLNSREAYVAAISGRSDAFAFGSAPGDLMIGGPAITKAFTKMKTAQFTLNGAPRVVEVSDDLLYAAANVDFTNASGTETFRVLLALMRNEGKLEIVQAHWSNGGPF